MSTPLLIVGEIVVDFTLTPAGTDKKLRLGGIVHAARALWAMGRRFSVAAVCPRYLRDSARAYLERLGCAAFIELGEVSGAPSVMVISDPIELGDQGYDYLLREEKTVSLNDAREALSEYNEALVFPGAFDLYNVYKMLPSGVRLHLDIAYDVHDVSDLLKLVPTIETILISTSSKLFKKLSSSGIRALSAAIQPLSPTTIVLKENRGGTRIIHSNYSALEHIPAMLGTTANSVGVGDAFSAAYVSFLDEGSLAAGLKASRVSSAYAQTIVLDVFKTYVERSLKLTVEQMRTLGGTSLPWEDRPKYQIYLAAPDFSYAERRAIDEALAVLEYHNFAVRRPVQENGELSRDADIGALTQTYRKDVDLLAACALVLAVPTDRDPGTLVEIGLAIQMNIPVIVYDPCEECRNAMVGAGSYCYSQSLDECLTAIFTKLSDMRVAQDG